MVRLLGKVTPCGLSTNQPASYLLSGDRVTCKNIGEFIRRIAIDYVRYGYVRYVIREIPEGKNTLVIDNKLRAHYKITSCRTTRMRRRQKQQAVVQYVRYGRQFVLLATEGKHDEFERLKYYDCRIAPIQVRSYSIGLKNGVVRVCVRYEVWAETLRHFERIALHDLDNVEKKINALPYCHFPGVIRQKQQLVSLINQKRSRAGLPPVTLTPRIKELWCE